MSRHAFEGVLNVVRFNWPMMAIGAAVAAAGFAIASSRRLPIAARLAGGAAGGGAAWLVGASLAASHWIYDRSDLYGWRWLRQLAPPEVEEIANLHAGFDETSEGLREAFPMARVRVLDFHDPAENTEPSIIRARRLHPPAPGSAAVRSDSLGLEAGSLDLACCILSAHEIRSRRGRIELLTQMRAALRDGGLVVVAEHLRDAANFAAFGPGAMHFFPRSEWLRCLRAARLLVVAEVAVTPFVRVFACKAYE